MTVELMLGDCLDVMATLPDNSVDTIITDPPYGLEFMGKDWDKGVPGVHFWGEMLRIAKPGACLMAMGGTRTYHRLASVIEDAGFEIRDTIAWVYGSGFPKSYNISKGIDKFNKTGNASWNGTGDSSNGALGYSKLQHEQGYRPNDYSGKHQTKTEITDPEAQLWNGWGTALKPAFEQIVVAMKPIDGTYVNNALTWGVAGLWIDGGRVGTDEELGRICTPQSPTSYSLHDKREWVDNSAGKGRFPANFVHDGSDEVVGLFPQTKSGGGIKANTAGKAGLYGISSNVQKQFEPDSGSAARFFYCAKASRSERNAGLEGMEEHNLAGHNKWTDCDYRKGNGEVTAKPQSNHHPTVKPIELMRYLVRLTKTPTGGIVLDPFMGSGTTGIACVNEGRDFIGIEKEPEYFEIAQKRIEHAKKGQMKLL